MLSSEALARVCWIWPRRFEADARCEFAQSLSRALSEPPFRKALAAHAHDV